MSGLVSDPLAVFVVLAGVVWLALRLEQRDGVFRSLGAGLVAILLAMLLSNVGVLPGESPTYGWLASWGVSLAVALILLRVDVRSVADAGPRMLLAFAVGAASTTVGALTGALLVGEAVGPEAWKLAGQFTATYTGGGMNFAALARALDTSNDLFTAAVAADVSLTAVWMVACLAAPLLLDGRGRGGTAATSAASAAAPAEPAEAGSAGGAASDRGGPADGADTLERALTDSVRPLALVDLAAVAALAVAAVWAAGALARVAPALPEVLWLTTIVLLIAQLPVVQRLTGAALLGNYLLLLFLAANGAQSVVANIFRLGPAVFWFALTTVLVHGIGIFGVGRLLGLDAGTLAIASQANIGGPPSAVALASARGYASLVLPGVAAGLLGYAVGNYLGFGVAALVRMLIGGT